MVKRDASKVAEKWATHTKASTSRMREGVEAVTESPMKKAKDQQELMKARLLAAIEDGKWARGLDRVSLSDWKQSMSKGIDRVSSGVDNSMPKTENFFKEFLPHLESGVKSLPPRGNIEANIERATKMIRHNAKFRRSGR